jgi:HEPN domain-containing protein
MPPKEATAGTPQDWLRRAKGNLARAKQPKPKAAFWEDFCFDAQQAAEKAVKAVLRFHRIDFPKSHACWSRNGNLKEHWRSWH